MEGKVRQQDFFSRYMRVTKTGQLAFAFEDEMMEKKLKVIGGKESE